MSEDRRNRARRSPVGQTQDIHRSPPHSAEAEEGVLGSMLLSPYSVIPECVERISEQYFYIPAHQTVYVELVRLWRAAGAIDLITFTQVLRDKNLLDSIGGASFITSLYTFVPTAANANYYLDIVRDKFVLREIIAAATESVRRAYEEQDEVSNLLEEVERKIMAIGRPESASRRSIDQIVGDVMENLAEPEKIYGISTGYPQLDELVGGYAPGAKIVIAAKTSAGKSALAANLAHSLAVNRDYPTAIFTFEMNANQFAQRIIQIRSGVSIRAITRNEADAWQYKKFNDSASEVRKSKLIIINERLDIAGIRARCLQLRPRVAIIDYLQIVPEKREKGESITERLDRMSTETKQIADNLGITVIELSQVTEDSHGVARTRYSSGITNDADQLWHVTGDDDDSKPVIDKTVVVAKQREGPKGEVEFRYEKAITRFTEQTKN